MILDLFTDYSFTGRARLRQPPERTVHDYCKVITGIHHERVSTRVVLYSVGQKTVTTTLDTTPRNLPGMKTTGPGVRGVLDARLRSAMEHVTTV